MRHNKRHQAGKCDLAPKTRRTAFTFSRSSCGGMDFSPRFTRPTRGLGTKEVAVMPKRKRKRHYNLIGTWPFSTLDFNDFMLRKIPIAHSLSDRIRASFARNSALEASSSRGDSKLNFTLVPSFQATPLGIADSLQVCNPESVHPYVRSGTPKSVGAIRNS